MDKIIFLGTGGGRYMLLRQVIHTGGFFIELGGKKILVDPGLGCVVRAAEQKLDLTKLDCILLSHSHPDHGGDINVALEAMGKGLFISEKNCLEAGSRIVDEYHEKMPAKVVKAKEGEDYNLNGVKIKAVAAKHDSPAVGFMIERTKGYRRSPAEARQHLRGEYKIGYTGDSMYFQGQEKYFKGCDTLIINLMLPESSKGGKHMDLEGAEKLINRAKPKKTIIQHFGFTMLRYGINKAAKGLEKRTGIKTIAAKDGKIINGKSGKSLEKFL